MKWLLITLIMSNTDLANPEWIEFSVTEIPTFNECVETQRKMYMDTKHLIALKGRIAYVCRVKNEQL